MEVDAHEAVHAGEVGVIAHGIACLALDECEHVLDGLVVYFKGDLVVLVHIAGILISKSIILWKYHKYV